MAIPAILWDPIEGSGQAVRCRVCAHGCRIEPEHAGLCRMRVNRAGELYSLSADRLAAVNLDPVEKKPLFHFLPGSLTFSIGTPGCNMTCSFCQNHGLSQARPPVYGNPGPCFPETLIDDVLVGARLGGAASIAFTYNEPIVSVELIDAVTSRAADQGFSCILVSNGYAGDKAMDLLADRIQAANFDLKSFNDGFYRDLCGARLAPVLKTLARAVDRGWWVEVTTLLIPGRNDSDRELRELARFIKEDLGESVPWHISRFRPMHRLTGVPPTPLADLERARAVGLAEGLRFVYTGNVAGHEGESTYCPSCGVVVISRKGYRLSGYAGGACSGCGTVIPGVWSDE